MNLKSNLTYNLLLHRALHKIPELAFKEEQTSAYLRQELKAMGIPFKYPVAVTGIVATIGTMKGPRYALRSDMDALPIKVRMTNKNLPAQILSTLVWSKRLKGIGHNSWLVHCKVQQCGTASTKLIHHWGRLSCGVNL